MSEFAQGDAGVGRRLIATGLAVAVGLGAYGVSSLESGGGSEATADDGSGSGEWFDIHGAKSNECLDSAETSGTAKVVDMTIAGNERRIIQPDIGSDKQLSDVASETTRFDTNSFHNAFVTGPEKDALKTEAETTLCESPIAAVTMVHMIGNTPFNGQRVADSEAGEWTKQIADMNVEELNDEANRLLGLDLKSTDVEEHYERYEEHQKLAESVMAVLDNAQNLGLQTGDTQIDYSYDTANAFATIAGVPEIIRNEGQFEDVQALMFAVTEKGKKCASFLFGFNAGVNEAGEDADQRPETFVPEDCVVVTTTTNPDGSTTTHMDGTTTTTNPDGSTTTTSWRTSNTVTDNTVIEQPGAGGEPDEDNDPDNNTTTSIAPNPSTTSTTIRLGDSSTTTTAPQTGCTTPACE